MQQLLLAQCAVLKSLHFHSIGSAPERIFLKEAEVHVGDSAHFKCISDSESFPAHKWVFNSYHHVDEKSNSKRTRVHIDSVNLMHNGQYTCIGIEMSKSKREWNYFIASAYLHVLGKTNASKINMLS